MSRETKKDIVRRKRIFFLIGVLTILIIISTIVYILDNKKDSCSDIQEGYLVECFDAKGGDWISIYPVDYLNSTGSLEEEFDAFDHSQMCVQYDTEQKSRYKICIEEMR